MPGPSQHPGRLDAEKGRLTPEASERHPPGVANSGVLRGSVTLRPTLSGPL